MDWIVGKADLFNDVPMNLVDSATERFNAESNMKNIILAPDRCVAIDIDLDMSYTRWPLFLELLEELRDSQNAPRTSSWVKKVMMPMLCLIKSGGQFDYPSVAFKKGYYKEGFSESLMQLGLLHSLALA